MVGTPESQIAGKDSMKTENSQITSIGVNFSSTSHKIAISMTDLINQSCGDFGWLTAFPREKESF